jgi:hypothetical protein
MKVATMTLGFMAIPSRNPAMKAAISMLMLIIPMINPYGSIMLRLRDVIFKLQWIIF